MKAYDTTRYLGEDAFVGWGFIVVGADLEKNMMLTDAYFQFL